MAAIGVELDQDDLIITKNRDFRWTFQNLNEAGSAENFPSGSLYIEFATSPVTKWNFVITGSLATLKIESEVAKLIPARTRWQLVFQPTGEAAGGDALGRGIVRIQE